MYSAIGLIVGGGIGLGAHKLPPPYGAIVQLGFIGGGFFGSLYIAWDTRRMQREQTRAQRAQALALIECERMLRAAQPHLESTMRMMEDVEASRAELWRAVLGKEWPPARRPPTVH
jgi:hypothetical protein